MTTNLSTRRIIVTDFSAFYLQDGGEKRREMGHSPHRYETKLRHCHAMYMASGAGATCLVAEGSVGSGHYRPATLADVNFSLCMLWMAPYWVTRARVCVGGPALRRLSLSLYHDRDVYVTTRRCIATALGRFAHLYCSLAGNDSYASREEVRAAGRR